MNSGVIFQIEYKREHDLAYSFLDFAPFSGVFQENFDDTKAGLFYPLKFTFKIPSINSVTDNLINSISGMTTKFRITDADGCVYDINSDGNRALFIASRSIDGSPGSFRGYNCQIIRKAPTLCPLVNP